MNLIKIIPAIFLVESALFATQINVATYNIDTNIVRREEGFARETHEAWGASNRQELIKQTVSVINKRHNPDVWLFQEGRIFTTKKLPGHEAGIHVDSVTKLAEHLKNIGYKTLVSPYNESGGKTFQYITAFKPERFVLVETKLKYFSKTPDAATHHVDETTMTEEEITAHLNWLRDHNLGEIWERAAFLVHLVDKETNQHVWVINFHAIVNQSWRMKAVPMLERFAMDINADYATAKIIIGGDFNSIPGMGATEMMAIFKERGFLSDATEGMPLFGKTEPFTSTFFPFPYDFGLKVEGDLRASGRLAALEKMQPRERKEAMRVIYRDECLICGESAGVLDRVLYHGFSRASATVNPVPLFPDDAPVTYAGNDVKNYVLRHYDDGPAFASDHQPVVAKLVY